MNSTCQFHAIISHGMATAHKPLMISLTFIVVCGTSHVSFRAVPAVYLKFKFRTADPRQNTNGERSTPGAVATCPARDGSTVSDRSNVEYELISISVAAGKEPRTYGAKRKPTQTRSVDTKTDGHVLGVPKSAPPYLSSGNN